MSLPKIPPIHPNMIPPKGAIPAGRTADNRHQLYRVTQKRAKVGPKMGKHGQEYRTHSITGEQLYPLREVKGIVEEEKLIFLHSQGNGNIMMVDYKPPTPDEIAEAERAGRVEEMKNRLAEVFVDSGFNPDQLLELLKNGPPVLEDGQDAPAPPADPTIPEPGAKAEGDEEEEDDDDKEPDVEYPVMYAPGRWRLSNGQTMQGKKEDAIEAEALAAAEAEAQAEAKAQAAQLPEG